MLYRTVVEQPSSFIPYKNAEILREKKCSSEQDIYIYLCVLALAMLASVGRYGHVGLDNTEQMLLHAPL